MDNSASSPDLRAVTAILYLNGEWSTADGGALRLFDQSRSPVEPEAAEPFLELEPRRGTLVLFWSHLVPHEVLPARAARYALSLWMCVEITIYIVSRRVLLMTAGTFSTGASRPSSQPAGRSQCR